ncbi:MAG: CHAT domain-containing protein [Bacteroidales bacterium]|nr:CHAT domain-containing protein [Bacteroidales bacterium]
MKKITLFFLFIVYSTIIIAQDFDQTYRRAKELYDSAQWQRAEPYFLLCRELAIKQYGENSLQYADILSINAELSLNLDKYDDAYYLINKSITIFNQNLNNESIVDYSIILLRTAYFTQEDDILFKNTVEEFKNMYGKNSNEYANSLFYLAKFYINKLENYQHEDLFLEALKIKSNLYGNNSIECARIMLELSFLYYNHKKFNELLNYSSKASEIIKNSIGENNPEYAFSLNCIALAYELIDDYEKQIELLEKAKTIFQETLGENHSRYFSILNNIAYYYAHIGEYNKAIQILNGIKIKYQEKYGFLSSIYADFLINLGSYYSYINENNKAIDNLVQAINIYKKIYGDNSDKYALCLNNLSVVLALQDKNLAIKYLNEASEIFKKNHGIDNADYIMTLNNLALYYDGNEQIEILKNVVALSSKVLNKYNSFFQLYNNNLGYAYLKNKQFEESVDYLVAALEINIKRLSDNFAFMSSEMKEHYCEINKEEYDFIRKLIFKLPYNQKTLCAAYNGELVNKSVLLASELQIDKMIKNSGDTILMNQYEEINNLKQLLTYLIEDKTKDNSYKCDSIRNILDKMERNLSKKCQKYGDITLPIKIRWNDVQASLKNDEVAIEFIKENLEDEANPSYGALILNKDMSYPVFVHLFNENEFYNKFNDINYFINLEDTILYNMIWKPIEKYLKPNNKIYFAPIGLLTQTPIEFAYIDNTNTISDKYKIYRVSSTRNIVMNKKNIDFSDAIIYGGINYDTDTSIMFYNNKKYQVDKNPKTNNSSYLNTLNLQVDYLPGTEKEMNNIYSLLTKGNINCIKLSYDEATEESFKYLSSNSKSLIHIATHGFFIQPDDVVLSNNDALNFSGLLFSGCNTSWSGVTLPLGVDDGILTSKEISQLDLSNTDLVVLSACKTGVGLSDYEGVFGLQRGFIKAGAKTLIMSLWNVDDFATTLLMTEFYKHLSAGKSKYESFNKAVRYLRNYPNSKPKYWAAFIMLN